MREFTNHNFIIIERIREDENKRFFVNWDGYEGDVQYTQSIMFCTKLTDKGLAMRMILDLDKKFPDEKFLFRRLEMDFDVKEDFEW